MGAGGVIGGDREIGKLNQVRIIPKLPFVSYGTENAEKMGIDR